MTPYLRKSEANDTNLLYQPHCTQNDNKARAGGLMQHPLSTPSEEAVKVDRLFVSLFLQENNSIAVMKINNCL